jgi:hypothetical protein
LHWGAHWNERLRQHYDGSGNCWAATTVQIQNEQWVRRVENQSANPVFCVKREKQAAEMAFVN